MSFLAYQGRFLEVTWDTDAVLAAWYPEVDRRSVYNDADSWLWAAPPRRRPKNVRRFLRTWMLREKRAQERQAMKDRAIQGELHVGDFRR